MLVVYVKYVFDTDDMVGVSHPLGHTIDTGAANAELLVRGL